LWRYVGCGTVLSSKIKISVVFFAWQIAAIFAHIIKKSRGTPTVPASQLLWYRFRRFESGGFAIIRVMQRTGICGICDNDRKMNQGRSTTTVSAGVAGSYKKGTVISLPKWRRRLP